MEFRGDRIWALGDSLWDLTWLSKSILSLQGHASSKAMMLAAILSNLASERDV